MYDRDISSVAQQERVLPSLCFALYICIASGAEQSSNDCDIGNSYASAVAFTEDITLL